MLAQAFDGPKKSNLQVTKAPSAGTIADSKGLPKPISGIDGLPEAAVAAPNPLSTGSEAALAATCSGCTGYNQMGWVDYGAFEDVRVYRNQNTAGETIDNQNHHVALISSAANVCYDGDYRYTKDSGTVLNQANTALIRSPYSRAFNDKWTQASGHNWYDDGGYFFINGSIDQCKQF